MCRLREAQRVSLLKRANTGPGYYSINGDYQLVTTQEGYNLALQRAAETSPTQTASSVNFGATGFQPGYLAIGNTVDYVETPQQYAAILQSPQVKNAPVVSLGEYPNPTELSFIRSGQNVGIYAVSEDFTSSSGTTSPNILLTPAQGVAAANVAANAGERFNLSPATIVSLISSGYKRRQP